MMLSSRVVSRPSAVAAPRASAPLAQPRCVLARAATVEKKAKKETKQEENHDEDHGDHHDVTVDTKQVASFLNILVNETSIAQLNLKVGNFHLKVKRSVGGAAAVAAAAAPAAPAPAPAATTVVVSTKPAVETLKTMEETIDESLIPILSPKVGIFRRGKYAGGKRMGKGNSANEGDQVKRGQPLGYVEQLGTFVAVEAPQAGEIVKFLIEDGKPVEYQQQVIEMAPFFGGHIIGDSKHA